MHALLADGPRPTVAQFGLRASGGLLRLAAVPCRCQGHLAVDGRLADGAVAAQQVLVQPRVRVELLVADAALQVEIIDILQRERVESS